MTNFDNTPIAMMTAGQLKSYLFGDGGNGTPAGEQKQASTEKRYLYSVKQLAAFLNVSYPTAWKLKDTTLRPAVYQQGRTILFDVEKVLELMGNGNG